MRPSNYTILERFLWNFYIIDADKVIQHEEENLPHFLLEILPIYTMMIIVENIVLFLQGKPAIRINDGITSIATGIMMTMFKILPFGIEFYGYKWLYNYRLFNPDWDSPWTWWYVAVLVDFCYYWIHRMSHEVNILWGIGHQVHHSSEEYNFTMALRQPAFLKFLNHGLYHPLALIGVPMHAVLIHVQFNLIYQFWIHTETIGNIGPLEFVLNTASHHRVHHGMNNWCLDKNYGSVFIIWDRIFGTFQAERKDEKIIYGLVDQPQTFDPLYLQTFYLKNVVQNAMKKGTVINFIKGIFYGPAWYPGSPRLGDEPDMTVIAEPRKKFDPVVPWYIRIYAYIQSIILLFHLNIVLFNFDNLNLFLIMVYYSFIFWSIFIIGTFLDGKLWITKMEFIRCIVSVVLIDIHPFFDNTSLNISVRVFLVASSIFCIYKSYKIEEKSK